jgi:hypothetical protein
MMECETRRLALPTNELTNKVPVVKLEFDHLPQADSARAETDDIRRR